MDPPAIPTTPETSALVPVTSKRSPVQATHASTVEHNALRDQESREEVRARLDSEMAYHEPTPETSLGKHTGAEPPSEPIKEENVFTFDEPVPNEYYMYPPLVRQVQPARDGQR